MDRRAAKGKALLGPAETLGLFADFVRGRVLRDRRNRLGILTLCLLGLTLGLPALL